MLEYFYKSYLSIKEIISLPKKLQKTGKLEYVRFFAEIAKYKEGNLYHNRLG
jgi:hypothetical protein